VDFVSQRRSGTGYSIERIAAPHRERRKGLHSAARPDRTIADKPHITAGAPESRTHHARRIADLLFLVRAHLGVRARDRRGCRIPGTHGRWLDVIGLGVGPWRRRIAIASARNGSRKDGQKDKW